MLKASNDNEDPLDWPDTGLPILYRLRREVLALQGSRRPLPWWRERRTVIHKLDEAIRHYLACL